MNADFLRNLDFENFSVYDVEKVNTSNGGVGMLARDIISAALKHCNMSQRELAAKMGWIPQKVNDKLNRGSLKADEFLRMMEIIGVKISYTGGPNNSDISPYNPGVGHRFKRVVDLVKYDTGNADAIAGSFFADGVNKYTNGKARELYRNRDFGEIDQNKKKAEYFFAEYSEDDDVGGKIVLPTKDEVVDFIAKYGCYDFDGIILP